MSKRFVETLHEGYAQSLSIDKVLYDNASNLQHIQVFENRRFVVFVCDLAGSIFLKTFGLSFLFEICSPASLASIAMHKHQLPDVLRYYALSGSAGIAKRNRF